LLSLASNTREYSAPFGFAFGNETFSIGHTPAFVYLSVPPLSNPSNSPAEKSRDREFIKGSRIKVLPQRR